MKEELVFAKAIEELKDLAFLQDNVLSMEQVKEGLGDFLKEETHLLATLDYLKQCKIGIDEAVNLEDYLTQEEKDYVALYMEEIKQLKSYTEHEIKEAFVAAMQGKEEAVQAVIEICLPEIVDIAKLYTAQGVYIEDLIGEGNMILLVTAKMLECCDSVEEARAVIAQSVMEAMEHYILENTEEKQEESKLSEQVNKVAKAAKELAEELQKEITIEELMQEYNFTKEFILEAMAFSGGEIDYINLGETNNGA